MTDNIIKEQIAKLDPQYREFILGVDISLLIEPFALHHKLDEDKALMLTNSFILYLTFLFSFNDLKRFIETELDFDEKEANLLAHGLTLTLPPPIKNYVESQSELIFTETENLNTETTEVNLGATIETKEATVTPSTPIQKPIINPLRTMATDSKEVGFTSTDEPVYTSVQNAIINETRWGSDDGK